MARRRRSNILPIVLIVGLIILGVAFQQGKLFTTIGGFTLASFELDDYGEYWFSESPLSFGEESFNLGTGAMRSAWFDQQKKFVISSRGKPFVRDEDGVLEMPSHQWTVINAELEGRDVKVVLSLKDMLPSSNLVLEPPRLNIGLSAGKEEMATLAEPSSRSDVGPRADPDCFKTIQLNTGDLHVVEWRSSSLTQRGALFLDGIKVCEKDAGDNKLAFGTPTFWTRQGNQFIVNELTPIMELWAVGQRLPFNCRIDTSHEAFFLDRPFPAGSMINLNSFAFEPVAFCADSPVVQVASAPEAGVDSTTEPFLRWAEGKSLEVPPNQIYLVTYVADWKRAGLQTGCASFDRYLVEEKQCESQARIVIAQKDPDTGKVEVSTLEETGKIIEETVTPPERLITLDEAPKAKETPAGGAFANFMTNPLVIGVVIIIVLITAGILFRRVGK